MHKADYPYIKFLSAENLGVHRCRGSALPASTTAAACVWRVGLACGGGVEEEVEDDDPLADLDELWC